MATIALVLLAAACSTDERPAVLFVTVDTVRADHLGVYGFEAETSPRLDALAAQSVVFDRALAASSRTAPSHATMMTSRWVREHSIGPANGGSKLAESERTLAVLLHEAGWDTAAFISNFVLARRVGLDVGFDVYDDELKVGERNRAWMMERNAVETTDRAAAWLDANRDAPFFVWVHYNDPHGPYEPPAPHDGIELAPPDGEEPNLPVLGQQLGFQGIPAYQELEGVEKPSEYVRRYAGEIAAFDESLGRLIETAERAAAPRPLIVILTADHGESLGEEDIWFSHGHGTTPELAHVPFLLRAPGLEPGRRSETVHHVDILPTVLDLVQLPIPVQARGIALGPVARDGEPVPDRPLFVDVGHQISVYRGDRFLRAHIGKPIGNIPRGTWQGFRWLEGSKFVTDEESPDLRTVLDRYARLRPPMLPADALSDEQMDLMRGLGYFESR